MESGNHFISLPPHFTFSSHKFKSLIMYKRQPRLSCWMDVWRERERELDLMKWRWWWQKKTTYHTEWQMLCPFLCCSFTRLLFLIILQEPKNKHWDGSSRDDDDVHEHSVELVTFNPPFFETHAALAIFHAT